MQTRRLLNSFFLLVFLSLLLPACSPKEPTPVTITYYRRGYTEEENDEASKRIRLAVTSFQKRYPYITVNIVGIPVTPEGTAQLDAALEARENINVFGSAPNLLPDLVRRGIISDIEPFMTKEDKADYYDNAMQMAMVNGKVYAWPQWVTTVAMYGNPAMFKERGVTPPTIEDPWTWQEFVSACHKLTYIRDDGTQVYAFSVSSAPGQVVYLPIYYMDGGRVRSPDSRTFTLHQPEAVSALQEFADLHLVENVTPPDFGMVGQTDVRNQFKAGTVAMIMDTPSVISELQGEGIPFTVFPTPVGETGELVTSGGFGLFSVVQVDDPNVLAASHAFARYLTSTEIAQDVPGYQLAPSLRRSNTIYATDEARSIISRLVVYGIYETPVGISAELGDQMQLALQSILLGDKTAQQAMDEIAPLYQKELDEQVSDP
jgi:multiple sugar transport system substrate-binding protein